jgi:hypothetical protein
MIDITIAARKTQLQEERLPAMIDCATEYTCPNLRQRANSADSQSSKR